MRSITPSLTKLLVFVAVTLLATGFLGVTIANTSFGPSTVYSARFKDVTGVNSGDDVRIAGVKAGQVEKVRLADRSQAEVTFRMFGQRKLRTSETMVIKYRNLAGQRYLAIEQDPGDSQAFLPEGATIPLSRTRPALNLTVLFNGFKPLFQALSPQDVNKLSYEILQVLQGEGGTINSLLSHTASLTSTVADRDQVIGQVVDNLNRTLDTVNARGDKASEAVIQLQRLVSGLAADRRPIGDAITGIGALTDATSGLLAEARQPLREDIAGLDRLSQNLNDNQALVERFVQGLPSKVNTIMRTASYGSWFNFYLCQSTGVVGVSKLGVVVPVDPSSNPPARCQ